MRALAFSFLAVIAVAACATDAEPTGQLNQDLCKQDPLTGLCPGTEQQIAQEDAVSTARQLQPAATDIEVSQTCTRDVSEIEITESCLTTVKVAASTIFYRCTTVWQGNGDHITECDAVVGRTTDQDPHDHGVAAPAATHPVGGGGGTSATPEQLSESASLSEAAAENPNATDLEIEGTCGFAGTVNGADTYLCGVRVVVNGTPHGLACAATVRNGQVTAISCNAQ